MIRFGRVKARGYKVTVRNYGDNCVEAYWGVSSEGKKNCAERGESKHRAINIERSDRRAKAQVRRKCMAASLDHILTLTYRENIEEKGKAYRDFEKFIRHVHHYSPDWKYVAVPEKQGRGAIHFHIGIKGYQDVSLLRSLWRRVVGEGNIDVSYRKTENGVQWKKAKFALYLAKYIGKAKKGKQEKVKTELNERRFRASPGIAIPEVIKYLYSKLHARDYALGEIKTLGGVIGHVWSPEESNGAYGWACSWG